ncbi:unnamed protein product [Pseudo-nitzschia multistriata]|uniref:SET domain-containing protein n=1 Tax=Pseudo-nitzschia multistriata TaxID=183589 RepID=A0A448ZSA9_9STRA|nr:unnamed protein product [Pseudo-nitzschia multistriata]
MTPNTRNRNRNNQNNSNKKNDDKCKSSTEKQFTVSEEHTWDPPDPRIAALLSEACKEIVCHKSLKVVGRTLRATAPIEVDTKLYEIPRSMQIWDLDAYRDPFVRKHLFKAGHKISGNRMGTEAFLAAYLSLEIKRAKLNPSNFDPLTLLYFDSLPTFEEFEHYHPILEDKDLVRDMLGPRSMAHSVVQGYRNMVRSEYEGFAAGSSEFRNTIPEDEYLRARLAVLTRALNVGPPGPEEVMPAAFVGDEFRDQDLFLDELYSYYDLINVNLTEAGGQGCIAMVPIADLFNHHPNNNIGLQYKRMETHAQTKQKSGRSFVVSSSNRIIEPYSEPMASYGVMADAHLYARYGFVNGDGSGAIQLGLAFHHEMMKLNISNQYDYIPDTGTTAKFSNYQREGLAKYLRYDDGYPECISGPSTHPGEAELKQLKLQHLVSIANEYDRWNVVIRPPNPKSLPAHSTDIPITKRVPDFPRHLSMLQGFQQLQETCRVISLINEDFDGNAVQVLKENVGNLSFRIGNKVSDALEFRSFMCMSRWFGTRFVNMEVQGKIEFEYRRLSALNRNEYGSKNWTLYHVRFGEMQALHAASGLLFDRVSLSWESKKKTTEPEYRMRDDTCPEEYLNYLFRDDGLVPDVLDLR